MLRQLMEALGDEFVDAPRPAFAAAMMTSARTGDGRDRRPHHRSSKVRSCSCASSSTSSHRARRHDDPAALPRRRDPRRRRLSALEQTGRDRDARHARHLHSPGVAVGLELHPNHKTTGGQPFVDVTLTAGYAIDGTGRELVRRRRAVSPRSFPGRQPQPATRTWRDRLGLAPGVRPRPRLPLTAKPDQSMRGRRGPDRIEEVVEVEFGRPGDSDADQPAPAPDDGPGDGTWRVLVGFVQFDTAIGRFNASARAPTA